MRRGAAAMALWVAPLPAAGAAGTVAVFPGLGDPGAARIARVVEADLQRAGYEVRRVAPEDLAPGGGGVPESDVIVYAGGRVLPAGGERALLAHLRSGGRLIVLGAPALSEPAWRVSGSWRRWAEICAGLERADARSTLLDFEAPEQAGSWQRATNDPRAPGGIAVADDGGGGRCLQVDIPRLTGWDNWSRPIAGIPTGRRVLVLRAKGAPGTTQLMVELVERDGARWIAVAPLGRQWRFLALPPEEFHFWRDGSPPGRGGAGDQVRLSDVARISLGLAFSHTAAAPGSHRFWVDDIGSAPDPRPEGTAEPLVLDGLCPEYKYFPVRSAKRVSAARQAFVPPGSYPRPAALVSVSPRPGGTGFGKGRSLRFVPLLEARDPTGLRAGFAAWLCIPTTGGLRGSAWAVFGAEDPAFYAHARVRQAIVRLTGAMVRGVWLEEGGAESYAYLHDEPAVRLGARLAGRPGRPLPPGTSLRIEIVRNGAAAASAMRPASLGEDGRAEMRMQWSPHASLRAGGPWTVRVFAVRMNGRRLETLDVLEHPLRFWRPKPVSERAYVTAREGSFWLGGRRWAPHGVNYMPSSGIGLEDGEAFEHWIDSRAYDPEIVEEDLRRVRSLGLNSVSVFIYHRSVRSRNLLDLLLRCERLGLRVNLSLRPHADPFDWRWDEVREMIAAHRLKDWDIVFAYDLAWERGFGTYEPSYSNVRGRKAYDGDWRAWVEERYGSVEAAERDWGHPMPRRGGEVAGLPDAQLAADGPWRRMAAAYRRFLDDLASRAYGRAARMIRGIDPHHLISFRMTTAGDPTAQPADMPFEFGGLARALDIMEPEGYGRLGDWSRVRDGAFTAAWSRFAAPGRPVYWAEFGRSIWSGSNFTVSPASLEAQGRLYEDFYRMMALSRTSGSSAWWFAGGYRVNERSDYGILNPDGSDRPAARAIRRWMPRLQALARRPPPRVSCWIAVDRDADARGLFAVYQRARARFWHAIAQGRTPGLRDRGAGSNSANVPLEAVGGVPCNGQNPPRWLNAEFDRLEVRDARGRWVDVTGGLVRRGHTVVEVAEGVPVLARAVVGNTQEARWLAPRGAGLSRGAVVLMTAPGSPIQMPRPAPILSDVPHLATAVVGPFTLTTGVREEACAAVQMTAWGRAWFGEKVSLTLRPVPRPQ